MKYISSVLSLFGAGTTTTPEPEDTVVSVPPVFMPVIEVYKPQTLHFGWLISGVALESFLYGNPFTQSGALPASDTIAVRLGTGVWTVEWNAAVNRTFNAVASSDFFQAYISYDFGVTGAAFFRSAMTGGGFSDRGNGSFNIAVAPTGICEIYVHIPQTTAGNTANFFLGLNARKLL